MALNVTVWHHCTLKGQYVAKGQGLSAEGTRVESPREVPSPAGWDPENSSILWMKMACFDALWNTVLWLVHTTDADQTREFCLVRVGGVNKPLRLMCLLQKASTPVSPFTRTTCCNPRIEDSSQQYMLSIRSWTAFQHRPTSHQIGLSMQCACRFFL